MPGGSQDGRHGHPQPQGPHPRAGPIGTRGRCPVPPACSLPHRGRSIRRLDAWRQPNPSAVLSSFTYMPYAATPDTAAVNALPDETGHVLGELELLQTCGPAFSATRSISEECSAIHGSAATSCSKRCGPTRELRAQHAVHHKVGVSANGAGEMRICRAGQAVMPFALRFVAGALHGAQHERLHKIGFKPPLAFREHLLHGMRIAGHEPLRADAVEPAELREHGEQARQGCPARASRARGTGRGNRARADAPPPPRWLRSWPPRPGWWPGS